MFRRPMEFEMNSAIAGNNNTVDQEMNVDINMMSNNQMDSQVSGGSCCNPISETPQIRCVHRTIVHEVPHVCPIKTRIINHHVYKHTYRPEYSCSEENTVTNVQCGSCCNFR